MFMTNAVSDFGKKLVSALESHNMNLDVMVVFVHCFNNGYVGKQHWLKEL